MEIKTKVTKEVIEVTAYKCDSCGKQEQFGMYELRQQDFTDYDDDGVRAPKHACSTKCLSNVLSKTGWYGCHYIDIRIFDIGSHEEGNNRIINLSKAIEFDYEKAREEGFKMGKKAENIRMTDLLRCDNNDEFIQKI